MMKKTTKFKRIARDFVLLPALVLSCLALVIIFAQIIEYTFADIATGVIQLDVFTLLLLAVPFILAIKFLWNKAEEINIQQHIEKL